MQSLIFGIFHCNSFAFFTPIKDVFYKVKLLDVVVTLSFMSLQGYVHMWIDMFPVDVPPPPPVNIKPRLPER